MQADDGLPSAADLDAAAERPQPLQGAADAIRAEVDRLRAQNAQLLEALKFALDGYTDITTHRFERGEDKPLRDKMLAALRAARGTDAH